MTNREILQDLASGKLPMPVCPHAAAADYNIVVLEGDGEVSVFVQPRPGLKVTFSQSAIAEAGAEYDIHETWAAVTIRHSAGIVTSDKGPASTEGTKPAVGLNVTKEDRFFRITVVIPQGATAHQGMIRLASIVMVPLFGGAGLFGGGMPSDIGLLLAALLRSGMTRSNFRGSQRGHNGSSDPTADPTHRGDKATH